MEPSAEVARSLEVVLLERLLQLSEASVPTEVNDKTSLPPSLTPAFGRQRQADFVEFSSRLP